MIYINIEWSLVSLISYLNKIFFPIFLFRKSMIPMITQCWCISSLNEKFKISRRQLSCFGSSASNALKFANQALSLTRLFFESLWVKLHCYVIVLISEQTSYSNKKLIGRWYRILIWSIETTLLSFIMLSLSRQWTTSHTQIWCCNGFHNFALKIFFAYAMEISIAKNRKNE